ncbi:50S ribosomal protein L6 [Ammonifex thiophilus]|uniref:Large ribosomal subunit protein uL6 n=1 Tax=Ammonifex thiophilus TaxID=444093 RepID=A0A3D8P4U5_9THEO|nr:50S ribosomal protein L6 [Ammonifex thiophilus]RDV83377.1 50S ribosomal protein L6 [Ammonifex thiophilus]
MSRIGKKPVPIPEGVEVVIEGNRVAVKGPKGRLEREFPEGVWIEKQDRQLVVHRRSDEPRDKALHGLSRTLLNNMILGVTQGWSRSLEIVGVGYRAAKQGNKLVLSVGYSHPVEIEPPPGIEIEVPAPNKIVVKGLDKEQVGQLAAKIRSIRKPEPYKGKGIRYEGEVVRHKAGKTAGKGKK